MLGMLLSLSLFMGCEQKDQTGVDTSVAEPESSTDTAEPTSEPTGEPSEPTSEPSQEIIDNDGDGFTTDDGDCDDNDASINPNGVDYAADGVDQDCDGEDFTTGLCDDSCGYAGDGACDDGWVNAVYADCMLGTDCSDCGARYDRDGDGFYDDEGGSPLNPALEDWMDCDDEDPAINPYAEEIMDDGIDQDCNGEDFTGLCDNSCATANNAICEDGGSYSTDDTCALGTDCSDCGARIDMDGDGYDSEEDCDDNDPTYHPGIEDICNGIDDNCNGLIDEDNNDDEPNDASTPEYIGTLEDGARIGVGYLSTGDLDAFTFDVYDGWTTAPDFQCDIEAPADMDIFITLYDPDGAVIETNTTGLGGEGSVFFDPSWNINNNSGIYMVTVELQDGGSCDQYVVTCYYN